MAAPAPIITHGVSDDPTSIFYFKQAHNYMDDAVRARLARLTADINLFQLYMTASTEESCSTLSCKILYIPVYNTVFYWHKMGSYTNFVDVDYIYRGNIDDGDGGDIMTMNKYMGDVIKGVFHGDIAIERMTDELVFELANKHSTQGYVSALLGLNSVLNKDVCQFIGEKMLPQWLNDMLSEGEWPTELVFDRAATSAFRNEFHNSWVFY